MGSFDLFVAVTRGLECCDTAVRVDRQIYPHMRYRNHKDNGIDCPLDWYMIAKDDHDNLVVTDDNVPYAYIDLAGNWNTQYLPDQVAADGELGDHLPLEQWRTDVEEWVNTLPSYLRVVVCHCHD